MKTNEYQLRYPIGLQLPEFLKWELKTVGIQFLCSYKKNNK